MIHILDSNYKLKAILTKVTASRRYEEINGENILSFKTNISEKTSLYLTRDCVIRLKGDYFDVAKMTKAQNENGSCTVEVEAEHVSYRLNDSIYNLETFASTGTPTHVLSEILADTPFAIGTVEFTESVTFSADESKSRRTLLREFASYINAELHFNKFTVSLVQHRGNTSPGILSPNKNIKIMSQIYDKTNTDSEGNPLVSYTCTPVNIDLSLGDEVLLVQKELGIQEQLRIVSLATNPYNDLDKNIEISNQVGRLEDDIYRIETSTVIKGKSYNSCSISAENGFVATRGDGLTKSVVNATDGFSIYSGIDVDSLAKNFYVNMQGKIIANGIEINGDGTFSGNITGENVIGTNAIINGAVTAEKIKTDELVVGDNIQMGPNATISWGNVTNQPNIDQIALDKINDTYIDASGVWTPQVYAGNINTSLGKITTAQIENLTVGGNVTMGPNATITWGNVESKPAFSTVATSGSYSDLLNKPSIPTVPSYITSTKITSTTIESPYVSGGTITGVDILGAYFKNLSETGWIEIDQYGATNIANFNFMVNSSATPLLQFDNQVDALDFNAFGDTFLSYSGVFNTTYAKGAWNFDGATVEGIGNVVAVFG